MKKYENFCNALENLKDIYKYHAPYDNVVLTGLVGLYEICFEQSWKAIQEILREHGFPESQTGSPKQILKTAYQAGMLHDPDQWLAALNARNNVTDAYNHAIALDIVDQIKGVYYGMFCELKQEIEQNWMDKS